MYYHLEKHVRDLWVSTGFILYGEFRCHIELLSVLRTQFAMDFRAVRITDTAAFTLEKRGFKVLTAPEDYRDKLSNS